MSIVIMLVLIAAQAVLVIAMEHARMDVKVAVKMVV